jgi:hypothetical protein
MLQIIDGEKQCYFERNEKSFRADDSGAKDSSLRFAPVGVTIIISG